jgi:hypothetical protein
MSNGGIILPGGRGPRVGALLRFASFRLSYDSELVSCRFTARAGVRLTAEYANDPDNGDFRARRSRGWKSHKHRRQWEHNLVEAEKRAKNRRRKDGKKAKRPLYGRGALL